MKRGRMEGAERCRGEAFDFRVRQTAGPMVAARDHTIVLDKNRSYRRIRARASNPPTSLGQGRPHKSFVGGLCHRGTVTKRNECCKNPNPLTNSSA